MSMMMNLRRSQMMVTEKDYIPFVDPVVAQICADNWGDGKGITYKQAAAVTSIGTWFKGNTAIQYFDEYEKFVNASFDSNTGPSSASFNGCSNLKSIILPKTPTTMNSTFSDCSSLATVGNLEYVTKVGGYTFYGCSALEIEVNMPNLSGTIGTAAFRGSGITDVISLGAITKIEGTGAGTAVFGFCENLQSINLPSTLMELGPCAFYGCTSLEIPDLSLPNLTSLGQDAFYGVKIKKISNLGKITALPSASGSSQNYGDKSILKEVILPSSVTTIPNRSFVYYTALEHIEANGVAKIDYSAFQGCTSLTGDVSFPLLTGELGVAAFESTAITSFDAPLLTSVGGTGKAQVFRYCRNLRTVNIPSVTTIGDEAFWDCPMIERIDLPSSIISVGEYAFAYCSTLVSAICRATTPPTLGQHAFRYTPIASGTGYIYVPDASVDAYKAATNWSTYAAKIKPLSEYNG